MRPSLINPFRILLNKSKKLSGRLSGRHAEVFGRLNVQPGSGPDRCIAFACFPLRRLKLDGVSLCSVFVPVVICRNNGVGTINAHVRSLAMESSKPKHGKQPKQEVTLCSFRSFRLYSTCSNQVSIIPVVYHGARSPPEARGSWCCRHTHTHRTYDIISHIF